MGGRGGNLADTDAEGCLLEEGKGGGGCRQAPLLPDLHGILIPGPTSSTDRPPIKIEFSSKGRSRPRIFGVKGTQGLSKNCGGKMTAGGLGGGKMTAGGLGTRAGLFKGLRILPVGFKSSSQEVVSAQIKGLGGQVASLGEYDTCTHVCLGNELNKSLISENWISLSYDGDDISMSPKSTESSICSKRRRVTDDLNSEKKVRRELFPLSAAVIDEERIRRLHHQLFQCSNDETDLITLAAYASEMRTRFIVSDKSPGTQRKDFHTSTLLELKLICKECYLLLKALKKAGYTLAGNFNASNFVVTERVTGKAILFGELQKHSLQQISPHGEKSDEKALKRMVRRLFPKNVLPPHDMVQWLALIGREDLEGLLLNHWTLLEEQDARERFIFLCGKFRDLADSSDTDHIHERILERLNAKGYNNWQDKINKPEGNDILKNTLNRVNDDTKLTTNYPKHAGGLLRLLRNCRHHYAKREIQRFLMIVADHFPNLLMDFQEEMYKEGFFAQWDVYYR